MRALSTLVKPIKSIIRPVYGVSIPLAVAAISLKRQPENSVNAPLKLPNSVIIAPTEVPHFGLVWNVGRPPSGFIRPACAPEANLDRQQKQNPLENM
jgi:hypothetical protein